MKNLQARTEDKLRIISNHLDYSIFKFRNLFIKKQKFPENVKNILVIELKRIGDILVATPSLRALKKTFPDANLDIVIPLGMEQVLYNNPNLSKILTWEKEKIKENFNIYLNEIKNKYDLAVIFHNGTYPICKLLKKANIPYKIGCTRVGILEPKGYFLTKQLLPDRKLRHKIDDNLDVLKLININTEYKKPEAYASKSAEAKIKKLISSRNFIVIHPVSWTHPTWFKERFAELADKLIELHNSKIVFVGAEKESEFVSSITSLMKNPAVNLTGKTSIQELFALIKNSKLVIGIDSASTNIAAAFDTPVIALFGAGDSLIWHPYSKSSISIQKNEVCTKCMKSYCKLKGKRHLECMKAISVEDVLKEIKNLKQKI